MVTPNLIPEEQLSYFNRYEDIEANLAGQM